jgi:hypothetical protein
MEVMADGRAGIASVCVMLIDKGLWWCRGLGEIVFASMQAVMVVVSAHSLCA